MASEQNFIDLNVYFDTYETAIDSLGNLCCIWLVLPGIVVLILVLLTYALVSACIADLGSITDVLVSHLTSFLCHFTIYPYVVLHAETCFGCQECMAVCRWHRGAPTFSTCYP